MNPMKPESLHALVIDHHSGELTPEVVDLLEAYLALQPAAGKEAAEILDALALTSAAVARHPECVRVWSHDESISARVPHRKRMLPMWMKAAAVIAFSALTTAGGFYAGSRRLGGAADSPVLASVAPRKNSPWAQYRMALDPHGGGMQVVRVDFIEKEGRP